MDAKVYLSMDYSTTYEYRKGCLTDNGFSVHNVYSGYQRLPDSKLPSLDYVRTGLSGQVAFLSHILGNQARSTSVLKYL